MFLIRIQLTQIDTTVRNNVLEALSNFFGDKQLQEQIIREGIHFKPLSEQEFSIVQGRLQNPENYTFTNNQLTLFPPESKIDNLIGFLLYLMGEVDEIDEVAELLWNKGIIVKNLREEQAEEGKNLLEAQGAIVTIEKEKIEQTKLPRLVVSGTVQREDELPLGNLRVSAVHEISDKTHIQLGEDTTDAQGRYTIRYESLPEITDINLRILVANKDGQFLQKSGLSQNAKPLEIINITIPVSQPSDTPSRIEGQIIFEHGLPAEELQLRLYRRDFGDNATLLDETTTLAEGQYAFSYNTGGKTFSLEIRAVTNEENGEKNEIPLSKPLNYLGNEQINIVNLVAPSDLQPLEPEYQRLSADLEPHLGDIKTLSDIKTLAEAKENEDHQDLTVLNRATGWDARLIALAATSEKLAADADVQLPSDTLYGLLRAGLPSDKFMLAQVGVDVVEQTLKTVRDAGILELSDEKITNFKEQFTTFANTIRLKTPAPGSLSTYGDFLKSSELSDEEQQNFAAVYLNHSGNDDQLWEQVRKPLVEGGAGLNDIQISKLQLQGKLAFLTGNSEQLTSRLQRSINTNDPVQLVEGNFYQANSWINEINAVAGIPANHEENLTDADKEKLEAVIPPMFMGNTVEARQKLWAEDMARKVRLSYPTQVIGHKLENDNEDRFGLGETRTTTATLLKNAAKQGFRLGETPVEAFFTSHVGARADMTDTEFNEAKQQMKKLQCIYQITPTDEAMPVLTGLGITSAHDVMAYSKQTFLELYNAKSTELYGSVVAKSEAELVYNKATQVSSVTYNLFTIAKKLDSEVPVFGMSASADVRDSVKNELIKHYPTMESLFGSMDFCECEHWRSVLSPSAYLVDLLQFIDVEPHVWGNFLADWKKKHGDQDYTTKYKNPYDALIERRPELPNIQLTYENTHTTLPYIDIVNEILEYYVANDTLTEDAARDTGEATTAELLAEPQNVIREAYDRLSEAKYPLTLPFDLWLETVRQFCNYFETPLSDLLETFRRSDDLFAPTQPCDRASIFIESLGLSPAEFAIFSDSEPLKLGKWHELYGYPRVEIGGSSDFIINLIVSNSLARLFNIGDKCKYYDATTGNFQDEQNEISNIGAKDSGGEGKTNITFSGTWATPPKEGDVLVLANVQELLKSAKVLSRRLGVTYKEVVEIVQTGFVNPELDKLAILYKLGVSIQDVNFCRDPQNKAFYDQNKDLLDKERRDLPTTDQQRFDALSQNDWQKLKEVQAFEQRLQDFMNSHNMQPAQVENELKAIPFDKILVLADPDAGCNFDQTTLRYANGRVADDIAFLKINLFVRLWRKLGWTIEETDRALVTLLPKNTPFESDHLNKQPLKTALIYLAHLKTLDEKVSVGKQSRFKLMTLWSDIATTGKNSLYGQLFLTRSILKSDDVFDHPLGRYLAVTEIGAMAQARKHKVQLENVALADKIDPTPFTTESKLELAYDDLREVQYLNYTGVLSDAEKNGLKALLPASTVLSTLLDAVQLKAQEFSLVKSHLLALQGALGLTADEIRRILEDVGKSIDTAELSLAHVSLLYRYGLLAKALKLSIHELITLKQLSGLDPFRAIHADPLTQLDEDYPFTQTLRFIEATEEVKESGLKIEDLNYLLRHRFDETGKYRPNRENTLALLKTLAEGIYAIRTEHAIPEELGGMSDEVLQQKLGLVFPPDVVERFLSMMAGTAEFTTTTVVTSAAQLNPLDFVGEPAISQLNYNATTKEQKLVFRGILFDAQKAELKSKFNPKLTTEQQTTFANLLDAVQTKAKTQADAFFTKHLEKQPLNASVTIGFLAATDFDILFVPLPEIQDNLTDAQKEAAIKENEARRKQKLATLAKAFFPFLQQNLIRQFIVQTLTAQTGADSTLVESLLTDTRFLGITQSTGAVLALLVSFADTGDRGVSADFFNSDDGSGVRQETTSSIVSPDTALKDKTDPAGNPLPSANSARFQGYLEVPVPGAYRFYISFDKKDAEAKLNFDHLPQPLFLSGAASKDDDQIGDGVNEYLELKPGIPYRFTLEVTKLNGGDARLLVQGETIPKDSLDNLTQIKLYPLAAIEQAERAMVSLTKSLQLIQALGLSERELRYLLTHAEQFDNLDLKKLPTQVSEDSPDKAKALFSQFLRLASYTRLKSDLAGDTDDLIEVFEANEATGLDKVYTLITKLTRRNEATVKATAKLLAVSTFASEKPLQRLWEALQVVERFGIPVTALADWFGIVSPVPTPEQRFDIARDLKEVVKARFEPETWQRVAQPIFDKLRQHQRDALVAHIMHQRGFDRMEQLYEYFLIDPGMEPVVQTSRIRLAISSLQLFIQRCLLNLENQVHPSAIVNAKHWEWMKRYRVWEANRKIFLFPENWLEPEFRDDKTHLFTELEGALLQGDVSSDLVEDAFLNYLKKLDKLARLDIVAMHLENKADPAQNTLHVIGRTFNSPEYFYRRYAQQMWTPWEPVTAEIEGDHLAPVIWRDRLYLFWVTFLEKGQQTNNAKTIYPDKETTISPVQKEIEVQLHWSEYLQEQWNTGESSEFIQIMESQKYLLGRWKTDNPGEFILDMVSNSVPLIVPLDFDKKLVFIHVSVSYDPDTGEERGVYIHLGGKINKAFFLAGRNSTPEIRDYNENGLLGSKLENPYSASTESATGYTGSDELSVTFKQQITTEAGKQPKAEISSILTQCPSSYTLLPCNNNTILGTPEAKSIHASNQEAVKAAIKSGLPEIVSLMKPVFYKDKWDTLFIEPNVTETTIEKLQKWAYKPLRPEPRFKDPAWEKRILIKPEIPRETRLGLEKSVKIPEMSSNPFDPRSFKSNPEARFKMNPGLDWLVNPGTVLTFESEFIGPTGRAGLAVLPANDVTGAIQEGGTPVNVHAGSEVAAGNIVVLLDSTTLEKTGITQTASGLNIVGSGGFNAALAKNFDAINQAGVGVPNVVAGRITS